MSALTATHCPYCALQCGMNLAPGHDGLLEVQPRKDFPTNKGGPCQKGWTAADRLSHPARLTSPLARDAKGGALRPATWDEALSQVTAGIQSAQESWGQGAVGVFGGGGLTNEKAYWLGDNSPALKGGASRVSQPMLCCPTATFYGTTVSVLRRSD